LLFDLLDQMVIPDLIRRTPAGKEIRIWSAGCSCGQEAYSLAMLLDDRVESSDKHLQYRIFATDVSETALANARKGIYSTTDVKNVRHHHMQAYFTEKNGEYAVSQRLKDKVGFSLYDMLDTSVAAPPESIFGCFDIVCCSNLMMYYKAEIRSFILRKIENAVSQSGFLVVGEADRAFVKKNSALRPITVPVSAFRKSAYTHLDETDESFFDNI
jgi:chemotaxis methyl-accepting protein methylase